MPQTNASSPLQEILRSPNSADVRYSEFVIAFGKRLTIYNSGVDGDGPQPSQTRIPNTDTPSGSVDLRYSRFVESRGELDVTLHLQGGSILESLLPLFQSPTSQSSSTQSSAEEPIQADTSTEAEESIC